jgi:hypothetical protein
MFNKHKRSIAGITLAIFLISLVLVFAQANKKPKLFTVEGKILSAYTYFVSYFNPPPITLVPIATATVEKRAIQQIVATSIQKAGYSKPKDAPIKIEITETEGMVIIKTQAPSKKEALLAGEEAYKKVLVLNNGILKQEQKRIAAEIEKTENSVSLIKNDFGTSIDHFIQELSQTTPNRFVQLPIYLEYLRYKLELDEKINVLEERKNQLESITFIEAETTEKPTLLVETVFSRYPLIFLLPVALIFGLFLAIVIVSLGEWWKKNRSKLEMMP